MRIKWTEHSSAAAHTHTAEMVSCMKIRIKKNKRPRCFVVLRCVFCFFFCFPHHNSSCFEKILGTRLLIQYTLKDRQEFAFRLPRGHHIAIFLLWAALQRPQNLPFTVYTIMSPASLSAGGGACSHVLISFVALHVLICMIHALF